jgi:hypothetical protein
MAPVHSSGRGYPPGYQSHLPPEADVNQEAMRKQIEADERERQAENEAAAEEERQDDDATRTATAKPGTKQAGK